MKFICPCCEKRLSISYTVDPEKGEIIAGPWYRDKQGLNHVAIGCLNCGAIHDTSGRGFLGAILTLLLGRMPMMIHSSLEPMELPVLVEALMSEAPEKTAREIAAGEEFAIPELVIDAFVGRKLLGPAFSKKN